MKITIDANNDTIKIDSIEMSCKYPVQLSKILNEIFNKLYLISDNVELILIDEDIRKVIGEW